LSWWEACWRCSPWPGRRPPNEGEATVAAVDDVRQAIAAIVNKPTDMGTIEDKMATR